MAKEYYLDLWGCRVNSDYSAPSNNYIWNYITEPWENIRLLYEGGELEGNGRLSEFLFKKREKDSMFIDFNCERASMYKSVEKLANFYEDFCSLESFEIAKRKDATCKFLRAFFREGLDYEKDRDLVLNPALLNSLVRWIDGMDLASQAKELYNYGGEMRNEWQFLVYADKLFEFIKNASSCNKCIIIIDVKVL